MTLRRSVLAAIALVGAGVAACDARIDLGRSVAAAGAADGGATAAIDGAAGGPSVPRPCDGALGGCPAPACPTARIRVDEGGRAAPQTVLHLSADESVADAGLSLGAWRWTVDAPRGSTSRFYPAADVPEPVFAANVAGTYRFHLRVVDELGVPSCAVAEATVEIVPDAALHIELLWDTPGDLDPSDTGVTATGTSVGTDLDLHVLHPGATDGPDVDGDGHADGWFDALFDAFWYRPELPWGLPGPDDDPSLDRDDTDGAGPENLNIARPEDDVCYTVGVHAWDDWGYGASDASVRIYIHGTLVFEPAAVRLERGDLWEVARVCWPLEGDPIWPIACSPDGGPCVAKVLQGYPVPPRVRPL